MRDLQWKKADDWCTYSDPPGFTITRVSMTDGWKLRAWHGSKHPLTTSGPAALDDCKTACERARLEVGVTPC